MVEVVIAAKRSAEVETAETAEQPWFNKIARSCAVTAIVDAVLMAIEVGELMVIVAVVNVASVVAVGMTGAVWRSTSTTAITMVIVSG